MNVLTTDDFITYKVMPWVWDEQDHNNFLIYYDSYLAPRRKKARMVNIIDDKV
jgi:hypothetical protein